MAEIIKSFEFRQCAYILKSTGKKASNLRELRDAISVLSDESIFHHIYQYFLKGHILEYTNDFAHWAGESLEERALSERLTSIDPYEFRDIGALRGEIIKQIDGYLENFPGPRAAMPGEEFFFNETVTLVFPAGIRAKNLAEFLMGIKYADAGSIYYHFYEARIRLGVDDFSKWIEDVVGNRELSGKIRAIDPFMHNVEGIRAHIVEIVEEELKKDMEEIRQ